MKPRCLACDRYIPASDVNLDRMVAKCAVCGSVFSIEGPLPETPLRKSALKGLSISPVARPPRFIIEETGNAWRLQYRWYVPQMVGAALFCAGWDGFLIFWYIIAFASHGPFWMFVFPVLHVSLGIGITYFTLAGLLNRTTVEISQGEMRIRYVPVPWFRNRTLYTVDIQRFYIDTAAWSNNHGPQNLVLSAVLKDGIKRKLVGQLRERDEPAFLEQEISKRLRLAL